MTDKPWDREDVRTAFREAMIDYTIDACPNAVGVLRITRMVEDSEVVAECSDGCCSNVENFFEVYFDDANEDKHVLRIEGTLAEFLGVE
jgi:hypothetical protein